MGHESPNAAASVRAQSPVRHLTPEKVLAAIALVRTGEIYNLDLPLDSPPLVPPPLGRPGLEHVARMHNETRPRGDDGYVVVNDDVVRLGMQATSHWDALAHWGAIEPDHEGVFFGGRGLEETFPQFGAATLGMGVLGGGVVTRGVMLDLVGFVHGSEARWVDPAIALDRALIEGCLADHGVELHPGDAVLTYTGFQERLSDVAPLDGEVLPAAAGLAVDALPLFAEAGTFALISDNPSVEPIPMPTGRFHTIALKHLGIHLGELWNLSDLARACRGDGIREFLLVSSPLTLDHAFGSPANAIAIR